MAVSSSSSRLPSAMERTGEWVLSQDIPTDIIVHIGDVSFPLHKFLLVAKSGYVRRKIMDSDRTNLMRINLSEMPGGEEAFEKAAKFCYGVNFEISVHNVVALRCAAEYLEMTEKYCEGNLAGRTEEFLAQAALKTLPGAVVVLRSCEELFPMAEELQIVKRCIDAISSKACNEANFPTRIPPEWWAGELAALSPASLQKILSAMRSRGASPKSLAAVVAAYAERNLPDLLPLSGTARPGTLPDTAADLRPRQRALLESLAALLPTVVPDDAIPVGFLCFLLRAAIFLTASAACRRELERRISASLDQVVVANLLVFALDYSGERIVDLDSVCRIVAGFVEREMGGGGRANHGVDAVCCSAAIQKVARIVDAFVAEIATDRDLTVHKFAGIAGALPKSARRFDDDLYRAVDIYLKAHPGLHEIEREKLCGVVDPLRLSHEARLHAAQNNRLPLQIILHALYYDQLKLRSGDGAENVVAPPNSAAAARAGAMADASLMRENEALRSELTRVKLHLSEMKRSQGSSGVKGGPKKPRFFSSVSKTLGKLNPFRHGSKDTTSIDDGVGVDVTKPRRRRFSIG